MLATIKEINLNVQKVGKTTGKPYATHDLVYTNSEGKVVARSVFTTDPLAAKLTPDLVGQQVSLAFTPKVVNGRTLQNLVDIRPASEEPEKKAWTPNTTNSFGGNKGTDWAQKDLSMELGGLMHDAVMLVAHGKSKDVEDTLRKLVTIKKKIQTEETAARAATKPAQDVGVVNVAKAEFTSPFDAVEDEEDSVF